MTLFRNQTHQELWIEHNCGTCFQPDQATLRIQGQGPGCPILAKALREGRKPPQWDRMPRADEMVRTIKCNSYMSSPPVNRRGGKQFEDIPMFDVESSEVKLVPVESWPERPKKDGVDHA